MAWHSFTRAMGTRDDEKCQMPYMNGREALVSRIRPLCVYEEEWKSSSTVFSWQLFSPRDARCIQHPDRIMVRTICYTRPSSLPIAAFGVICSIRAVSAAVERLSFRLTGDARMYKGMISWTTHIRCPSVSLPLCLPAKFWIYRQSNPRRFCPSAHRS